MRKKKCYHVEKIGNSEDRPECQTHAGESAPLSQLDVHTRESSLGLCQVSDYSPGFVLEKLSRSTVSGSPNEHVPSKATFLPPQGPRAACSMEQAAKRTHRQLLWYKRQKRRPLRQDLTETHRRYLEEVGAFLQLPRSTTDALLPIYVSLLDDLIPVLDGAGVHRDYSNGQASPYLVKAICLVACKAKQAAPYLRLSDDGALLEPLEFGRKLLDGLDAAIKADLEPDRVTVIQVLALMHLHNDGPSGKERSSNYLSQAISEAWSLALHCHIPGNSDQQQCDLLWWSLRNFDHLNKPITGAAPFIINDSDIGIERILPRDDNYRSQLMTVALALGDLMVIATKVYKASSKSTVDECHNFPTLSEVASSTTLFRFHRSHRGTRLKKSTSHRIRVDVLPEYLETWYHIAAMLSCRFSGPGSVQYRRRLASADRILEIICHGGQEYLPPLPLVPYAMSMSTTIIYRALRDGQRAVEVACKDLRLCCEALNALGSLWTSSRDVAKLATRLWRDLAATSFPPKQPNIIDGHGNGRLWEETTSTRPESRGLQSPENDSESLNDEVNGINEISGEGPGLFQTHQVPIEEQVHKENHNFQDQVAKAYAGSNDAYSQLDMDFYDMFDYGILDVFEDSLTWDFHNNIA